MTGLSDVGACVFDAYGTLFDVSTPAARCADALGDDAGRLTALWRSKQLEYSWLRSLRGDFVDFWHVTGQSLDYAMTSLGIANPHLRSRLMEMYLALGAYPDVPETLSALKRSGIKTALLSNGSVSMLTSAVKSSGLNDYLDAVISVDPVRTFKPHPSVYQLAVDRMKLPTGQIGFVSSNYWDVSGAALFGFKVVWLDRLGGVADSLPGVPEARVSSLADLPGLLRPGAQG